MIFIKISPDTQEGFGADVSFSDIKSSVNETFVVSSGNLGEGAEVWVYEDHRNIIGRARISMILWDKKTVRVEIAWQTMTAMED